MWPGAREAVSLRTALAVALAAVALAGPGGCSGKGSTVCPPGPDGKPRDCQPWTGQPPSKDQRFFYSIKFSCSDGGRGARTVTITYRSAKDCEDVRSRWQREPDPCTNFGDEHWPGWTTIKREPVYEGESCD